MEIRMSRGDRMVQSFRLVGANGTTFQIVPDEIYFTVKARATDRGYKFQKRLSTGGIECMELGKYIVTILPEDTDGLGFGEYAFDIEVVKQDSIKKTFFGKFILDKEATHHYNEGD